MQEALVSAIRGGSAILVVGTGLSMAGSRNADCASWAGLLKNGIGRLIDIDVKDSAWAKLVESMLDAGFEGDDSSFAVQAASQVGEAFEALGGTAYADWLNGTVGNLAVIDAAVPKAVCALGIPILTTNYDTLIEQVDDRGSATWKNPTEMQRIISGNSSSIGHLHGIWSEPDSVVLTNADYEGLRASPAAQAIQTAFATDKSIIYIGVGSGLSDPNFSRFIRWQRETFPNPGVRHYRLCTNREKAALEVIHRADPIELIVYGEKHEELETFLASIREMVREPLQDPIKNLVPSVKDARDAFVDAIKAELIGNASGEDAEKTVDELSLTPIFLSVPYSQYLASKMSNEKVEKQKRLDPLLDVTTTEVILIVGEENSGLSFAAKWLALKRAEHEGNLPPVYVNFTECKKGPKPLISRIRAELNANGYSIGRRDTTPEVSLVLDDYSPYVRGISDRVIDDIMALEKSRLVVCVRQGTEEDTKARLQARGLDVSVRYIGRMERLDVQLLAEIVAPTRAIYLTVEVMKLLRSEHLPRTPFTVSQLLYILVRNGSVGASASSTSVLEEFVAVLLGRGDPHDDARFDIDHVQRMTILERLAEKFVVEDEAGLSEASAVASFETTLDSLGWPESATDVIRNFVDRRVLAKRGKFIVFARSSFLHLFAAKRAQKSIEFRDNMLARPVYYASAITDYAALNRHDTQLLNNMEELLGTLQFDAPKAKTFEEVELRSPNMDPLDIPELDDRDADRQPNPFEGAADLEHPSDIDDDDPPPFPVAKEEDIPPVWRALQAVDLASRVVRDADEAGDVSDKERLLGKLLFAWGQVANLVGADPSFQNMVQESAEAARKEGTSHGFSEVDDDIRATENIERVLPAAVIFGGINDSLVTRKLLVPMNRIIDRRADDLETESALAAIAFLFAAEERGWPSKVRTILKDQPKAWIFQQFILLVLINSHGLAQLDPTDEAEVVEAIVDLVAKGAKYSNDAQRKQHAKKIRSDLPRMREEAHKKAKAQEAISRGREIDNSE